MKNRPPRSDEGIALMTALLAVIVGASLLVVVVGIAVHNSDQAAADRRRLQSVDAAEAGVNQVISAIERASSVAALQPLCTSPTSLALTAAPANAHASTVVSFFRDYPPTQAYACSDLAASGAASPRGAVIESVGTTGTLNGRKIETLLRLRPTRAGFNAAIFSNGTLNTNNSFTVDGDIGTDGDIYTNGDWDCSNSPTVNGSVYVQGTAKLRNSCTVAGDLWAGGTITMENTSLVKGDATSSTGDIVLSGGSGHRILGRATAAGSIADASLVKNGTTTGKKQDLPPAEPLPRVEWNPADWTGYVVQGPYTGANACVDARNFIQSNTLETSTMGNTVVRIQATCTFSFESSVNRVYLHGNLAIITDGQIDISNSVRFYGNPSTPAYQLFLIVPQPAAPASFACPTSSGTIVAGAGTIALSNQVAFEDNLQMAIYTPCLADVQNLSRVSGQVVGGRVQIGNSFNMKFAPTLIPGTDKPTGQRADVAYVREVPRA